VSDDVPVDHAALGRLATLEPLAGPARAGAEPAPADPTPTRGVFGIIVLPGLALLRRRPITGVMLLLAGVIVPLFVAAAVIVQRDELTDWLTRSEVLRSLLVVGAAFVVARLLAVLLTAQDVEPAERARSLRWRGFGAVVLLAVPMAFVGVRIEQLRDLVDDVFADERSAEPLSTIASDPFSGQFQTVLLLGGDEGPGRFGLRTDTMILMIIERASDRAALVSIPRNLQDLRFPPGSAMAEAYPDGFTDLANAVYPYVYSDDELTDAYEQDGFEAGALALMQGISHSMGITIDDYALINMAGFVDVVDALGGVAIELDEEVIMPGNPPGAKHQVPPSIGPGLVSMDGTVALGYARSRSGDSDYQRMDRQRQLLAGLSREAGVDDVLGRFGGLAEALRDSVRTSMSVEEAREMFAVVQRADDSLGSVGLHPPLVEPGNPDYTTIQAIVTVVRQALAEGTDVDAAVASFTGN
jgi:polyisoprenyl-teichoic acid--peptidoglycan teichoic acid transferase